MGRTKDRAKEYAQQTAWRKAHPERVKEYYRKSYQKMVAKVLEHYGGRCVCCGEDRPLYLELDHIDNNGAEHRSIAGLNIIPWLVSHNFPEEFRLQILCANCHLAKTRQGFCPYHGNFSK